jgi:hypothetical protein
MLKAGEYFLEGVFGRSGDVYDKHDSFIKFSVQPKSNLELKGDGILGLVMNPYKWEYNNEQ